MDKSIVDPHEDPPAHWGPEHFLHMTFNDDDLRTLRDALTFLKHKNRMSWAQIEDAAAVPRRRIERFVRLKWRPNGIADLERMAAWVATMFLERGALLTRALKETVHINYPDVVRIWTAYSGAWFCISEGHQSGYIYGMKLKVFEAPEKHHADSHPLPKFSLELGSDDSTDDGERPVPHPVTGYIQLRDRCLYFVGQSVFEPSGRFGLMTFADRMDRPVREVMSGWGLLPTIDQSAPVPRKLVAGRVAEGDIESVPIGPVDENGSFPDVPNLKTLLLRLRAK